MALGIKIGATFIILLIVMNECVLARPKDTTVSSYRHDCLDEMQETCQKCAKVTKSPLVYPLCCKNEDGVFSWCEDYINFGSYP